MQKGPASARFVCLLASVIQEERRLAFFRQLLDSVRAQLVKPDEMIVSIFIDPSLEGDNGDQFWQELFHDLPFVRVMRQKRKKRQFVQIAEMLGKVEDSPSTFVIFSDDDDLWHPRRVFEYCALYNDTRAKVGDAVMPRFSAMIILHAMKTNNTKCPDHQGTSDVDGMIRCRCVEMRFLPYEARGDVEYHHMAVRPVVIKDFIAENGRMIRHNRFADMVFRRFVVTYKPKECRTTYGCPPHWMYFYRHCDSSYECVTNPILHNDTGRKLTLGEADAFMQYIVEASECELMKPTIPVMMKNAAEICASLGVTEFEFLMKMAQLKIKRDNLM